MNYEDFTLGYIIGYNNKKDSGGGESIIITEGTATIYNINILHNYIFEGTDFGIGIIDINDCPFLNEFYSNCKWEIGVNMKTKEKLLLPNDNPSIERKVAVAITKNSKVIGLIELGNYYPLKTSTVYYPLVDGSPYKAHGSITTCRIENQSIITQEIVLDSSNMNLAIFLEYDVVFTSENYKTDTSKAKQGIDDYGNMFLYYDKNDIDEYQGTVTSTVHQKTRLGQNLLMVTSDNYPESLRNKYQMYTFVPNVIWGTTNENIKEFHLGLTTGLSG